MSTAETVEVTDDKTNAPQPPVDHTWDDDFSEDSLDVPYKNEEAVENTEEVEEVEKPEEVEDAEVLTEDIPEPVPVVNDPGEYVPKDYSFTVELDGKKITLKTPEEAENFADDHADELSSKQIIELLRKTNKMATGLENDREKWEIEKEKYDEYVKADQERQESIDNLAKEMNYLANKGLVPKAAKEYLDADWSDPEVAKQPGVKEQIALLNYMTKENAARTKAGLAPLTSMIDVFNAWKLEQTNKDNETKQEKENQARKLAGARVAGVSSSAGGILPPKGIAVGNPNAFKRSADIWAD